MEDISDPPKFQNTDIPIENARYNCTSMLTFSWKFHLSRDNNIQTTSFWMENYTKQCNLTLTFGESRCNSASSSGYGELVSHGCYAGDHHKIDFSLEFRKKYPFPKHKSFKLIAYFNNSMIGHAFLLEQTSDVQFNTSSSSSIYEPALLKNEPNVIRVEISYDKTNYEINYEMLLDGMVNLYSGGAYSDVKIIAADRVFKVHKNIVAGRNEGLSKLIESGVINLGNWNPDVIEDVIRYLYTGTCDYKKNSFELFKLACHLKIEELQMLCNNYFKTIVNEKNLTNLMVLLKSYDLAELKEMVNDFIKEHQSSLAENLKIVESLPDCITLDNVTSVLELADNHRIDHLVSEAIRYICDNFHEAFKREHIKYFFLVRSLLLYKLTEALGKRVTM